MGDNIEYYEDHPLMGIEIQITDKRTGQKLKIDTKKLYDILYPLQTLPLKSYQEYEFTDITILPDILKEINQRQNEIATKLANAAMDLEEIIILDS